MSHFSEDIETKIFANISLQLMKKYSEADDGKWTDSPFFWLTTRPSRQKGSIAEQLISEYLLKQGFLVENSVGSDSDRLVNGVPIEIKMSTLWKGGDFRFQQIRDQKYDILFLLGIQPFQIDAWALPKHVAMHQWQNGGNGISTQHGGKRGADTAWICFQAGEPPDWLAHWGGNLASSTSALRRIITDSGNELEL